MTSDDLKVKDGLVVGLDYTLRLDDGEVLDTSEGQEPLEFLQGEGSIVSGLESSLYGMEIGEKKRVTVEAADGYGARDAEAVQMVSREVFPPDLELSPGRRLHMRDESGNVFTAYVTDVQPKAVQLDFNHPLAGERLHFEVEIASLRQATPEEMEHGHVHDPEDPDDEH
jgi:FKBP-type peptidyl-prolyl cis-trans isomerase SlyD